MADRKPLPKINHDYPAPAKNENMRDWLEKQMNSTRKFLLAFADDGVIWGIYQDGLKTAPQSFNKNVRRELREETLQQAYIFGDMDEVRLFRVGQEWKVVQIEDVDGQDVIDEYQVLWGSEVVGTPAEGFTHVRDRVQQSMDHALPIIFEEQINLDEKAPRLLLRHFIDYDINNSEEDTGETRVYLSRLVKLGVGPLAEEMMK
jgi:CRISPR-associated protein (TIGR03984 family)